MVQDLCVIMLTAGVTSLLFKMLKQPVVLGYIVAGMLVGPYVLGKAWVTDVESVDTWGQIGVLFLLFSLGLEFSFKKLLQIGSTAIIAALTIVVGMMALGFLVGRLFGWNEMNSLFLGGMLCMSSTTIVFKALDDMGMRNHQFAGICFGILVVEDLFAVVLMVLLSSIATSRSFEGTALLLEIGKLVGYLVLWFVLGIYLLPSFLRRFKKLLNNETLTIFVVGLCLGMVLLATGAGFSSALGAFVMGSLMAETLEAERIERLMEPVKNIFGSIFFVSVGMMINPSLLVEYWLPIAVITLVVIVGQIFFASTGTLLSGQSLKVSLQTGFSLVQIGEFAFIIAALGQSLGVTDKSLYPIVVAVSVVTTFLTPFVMKGAEPTFRFLNAHLSDGTRMFLENYSRNRNTVTEQSTFQRWLRRVLLTIFVHFVIVAFIYLLFFRVLNPWIEQLLQNIVPLWLMDGAALLLLLLITSPFIYAIAHAGIRSKESYELWHSSNVERAKLIAVYLVRIVISISLVAYAIFRIFSFTWGVVAGVAILIVVLITLSSRVRKNAHSLANRFTGNLTAREKSAEKNRAVSRRFEGKLLDYDVHISDFLLAPESTFCGRSLMQLDIRNNSGVSVVRIVRGGININIPGGRTVLYPGDKIVVAGSDEQIARFQQMLDRSIHKRSKDEQQARTHVTLERFTVTPDNPLIGTTLMQSGIREQAQCIVMGIERDGRLITNPDPTLQFQEGDIVIAAGETERIKQFVLSLNPQS